VHLCERELRSKLARLQVQVEELQTDMQELLQYKNEGSNKDHQKIEKLEKMIAYAQMNFQELSGASSIFKYFIIFHKIGTFIYKNIIM